MCSPQTHILGFTHQLLMNSANPFGNLMAEFLGKRQCTISSWGISLHPAHIREKWSRHGRIAAKSMKQTYQDTELKCVGGYHLVWLMGRSFLTEFFLSAAARHARTHAACFLSNLTRLGGVPCRVPSQGLKERWGSPCLRSFCVG